MIGQKECDLLVVDSAQKPSKACLFRFLLASLCNIPSTSVGENHFLAWGLRIYFQTRYVRTFTACSYTERHGKIRTVFLSFVICS